MHNDDLKRYHAAKENLMRNEGTHPINKSWRSAQAEAEDKAELERDRQELSKMESSRKMFGGSSENHGYMGAGVTDQELKEKKERISRREADEAMYTRDKE